jgi:hypothetical protein
LHNSNPDFISSNIEKENEKPLVFYAGFFYKFVAAWQCNRLLSAPDFSGGLHSVFFDPKGFSLLFA